MKLSKKVFWAGLIGIIIMINSCRKNDISDDEIASTSLLLNGESWVGDDMFAKQIDDYIHIRVYNKNQYGDNHEGLNFSCVRRNLSIQRVKPYEPATRFDTLQSVFYTLQGGDVGCDYYDVLVSDTINNYIQIKGQNNDYKEIWGNFSMTYIRTESCSPNSLWPDTVRLRDGKFHLYLP